ncbi:cytochrome b [Komagataeibacter rhaeticus]
MNPFPLPIRILHWTMAALVAIELFLGFNLAYATCRPFPVLIDAHKCIGIAIYFLVILRLVLRVFIPTPSLPSKMAAIQKVLAGLSHAILYLLMFFMPLSGWLMLSASGYPLSLAGGIYFPRLIGSDIRIFSLFNNIHFIFSIAFVCIIFFHVYAALIHAVIYRDGVLSSIVRKRSS